MPKRRIAALKHFNGDTELENIRWFHMDDAGKPDRPVWTADAKATYAQFGTVVGARKPLDFTIDHRLEHRSDWLRVDRSVRYLTKPDPHECDFRCVGGKPGGDCWCQCGGRNHGRKFTCDLAA